MLETACQLKCFTNSQLRCNLSWKKNYVTAGQKYCTLMLFLTVFLQRDLLSLNFLPQWKLLKKIFNILWFFSPNSLSNFMNQPGMLRASDNMWLILQECSYDLREVWRRKLINMHSNIYCLINQSIFVINHKFNMTGNLIYALYLNILKTRSLICAVILFSPFPPNTLKCSFNHPLLTSEIAALALTISRNSVPHHSSCWCL